MDEINEFQRCVLIFDGQDETAMSGARAFWKSVKATRADATYWRQNQNGRWEKQA